MKKLSLALLAIGSSAGSRAALLWDYGPSTGSYGGCWANQTNGQNFAEKITFASAVTVTKVNYFSCFASYSGTSFHVKLLADSGGVPGAVLASQDLNYTSHTFFGTQDGNNVYKTVLDITALNLAANTVYWIGFSGNGFEAAQVSVRSPGDGMMAQFNGSSYTGMTGVGDQEFQLEGSVVPEPASMAVLGLGGLALLRRRKR